MRSSALLTAAFAASVLGAPVIDKRDLVVDTVVDIVMVTDYETVTAGASPVASATSVATTEALPSSSSVTWAGHRHSWGKSSSSQSTSVVASTSVASTTVAPVTTAASSTSVYVALASSTTESSAPSSAAASTSAASVTSAEASSTSAAASSVASTYQQLVVAHHNVHRANHSAADITYSTSLASIALSIAQTCVYEHNVTAGGGGYGQNIAAGVNSAQIGTVITDLFYNGEVNNYVDLYGQANPSMTNFENWGHFSQIVWKSTTTVGCATVDCSSSGLANVGSDVSPYFTVCNYESPGNYAGEYGTDVGSPLNRASVYGTSSLST